MTRTIYLLFSVVCYVAFLAAIAYLVLFVGNMPGVPITVDHGGAMGPTGRAIAVDLVLLALFGLQHSGMARRGFKRATAGVVPAPIERSLYVLLSAIVLAILYVVWRPIPILVWQVQRPLLADAIWLLFGTGWAIVLLSTFLISHFELFGLKQTWSHARGVAIPAPLFRTPFLYRMVRHPLYLGFIIAFFATPRMMAGHLLFACGLTVYILVAIALEEQDLVALFGEQYERYRRQVGMLAPRLRRPVP